LFVIFNCNSSFTCASSQNLNADKPVWSKKDHKELKRRLEQVPPVRFVIGPDKVRKSSPAMVVVTLPRTPRPPSGITGKDSSQPAKKKKSRGCDTLTDPSLRPPAVAAITAAPAPSPAAVRPQTVVILPPRKPRHLSIDIGERVTSADLLDNDEAARKPFYMRLKEDYARLAESPIPLKQKVAYNNVSPKVGWLENDGYTYKSVKRPLEVYSSHQQNRERAVRRARSQIDRDHALLSQRVLSTLSFLLTARNECEKSDQLLQTCVFDPSVANNFTASRVDDISVRKDRWCLNSPRYKPSCLLDIGYLLVETAVTGKNEGEVLVYTESLQMKFGGDKDFTGPVVQMGGRYDSKTDGGNLPLCGYLPLALTIDKSQEGGSFLSDLWLVPDFLSGSVSVVQVRESFDRDGKRLIYRQDGDSLWEVVRPESQVALTERCSFYLESPARNDPFHRRKKPNPRPEVYTFVSVKKNPEFAGIVPRPVRYYSVEITQRGLYAPEIVGGRDRSALDEVQRSYPSHRIKDLYGAGIERFNKYFHNFGMEYLGGKIDGESERVLQYEVITVDQVVPPAKTDRSTVRDYRTNDQKFFWSIFEYLYRVDPKRHWAILQVTGDGNCLFHCLAAWFFVRYPECDWLQFYDWLRTQSCDLLMDNIDNPRSPHNPSLSWLELFMRLEFANDDHKGTPEELDLRGENPPAKKSRWEPAALYQERFLKYKKQCATNKAKTRERYINSVNLARQNCVFNTEMQLMALAVLCQHVISVGTFNEYLGYGEIVRKPCRHLPCEIDETRMEIPVFFNPVAGAPHYVSACDLSWVAGFVTPKDVPKTTQTHTEYGKPRPNISTKYKNYKRGN
jgi:hypothetical protein